MELRVVPSKPCITGVAEGTCETCHDSGWTPSEANPGTVAHCPDCGRVRATARVLSAARIPFAFFGATLETIDAQGDTLRASDYAKVLASADALLKRGDGLLTIQGNRGVGKTHLACAILRDAVVNRGWRGLFVNGRDAIGMLATLAIPTSDEPTRGQIMQAMQSLRDVPLLVFDEVGHQRVPFAREIVGHTICGRYDDGRPTICVTNFGSAEMVAVFGDSVSDRLFAPGVSVHVAGGSRR